MKDTEYIKKAIEAIIFMSPRSVSVKQIYKTLVDVDKETIDICIDDLIKDYKKRQTSINIVYENNKLEMVISPEFNEFNIFATGTKLTKSELKTLGFISLNQPLEQSKLVKKRPFNDLKILKDLDLVFANKKGRKNIIYTTKKFKALFRKKPKAKK